MPLFSGFSCNLVASHTTFFTPIEPNESFAHAEERGAAITRKVEYYRDRTRLTEEEFNQALQTVPAESRRFPGYFNQKGQYFFSNVISDIHNQVYPYKRTCAEWIRDNARPLIGTIAMAALATGVATMRRYIG